MRSITIRFLINTGTELTGMGRWLYWCTCAGVRGGGIDQLQSIDCRADSNVHWNPRNRLKDLSASCGSDMVWLWYRACMEQVWLWAEASMEHPWRIYGASMEDLRRNSGRRYGLGQGGGYGRCGGIALFKLEKGCLIPDIKCSTAIYKLPEVERMPEYLQKEQEKDGAEFVHQMRGNDISF